MRTFQYDISLLTYLLLAALLSVALCLYWVPMPRPLLGVLLLAVISVMVGILERALHTEYIVHGGILTISKGRFASKIDIPLEKIIKATSLGGDVLVITPHAEYKIRPKNPESFIKCIEKSQA